ncbi:hypothetical protein [Rhizobium oryzicola]|uniref:Antifreeze protein n=1 Tax=Rhizobium oryzicola TaxID=1232668 RepID=A0ABT8SR47_9HYPH|nr:hypothetical protein [Rhizobium oryzicola]MDO1580904.1 hypothetical protein [Rhizobium oryzicola]
MTFYTEQQVKSLLQEFAAKGAVSVAGQTFAYGAAAAPAKPLDPQAARNAEAVAVARAYNKARTGRQAQSLAEIKAEILATMPASMPPDDRDRAAEAAATARAYNNARLGKR